MQPARISCLIRRGSVPCLWSRTAVDGSAYHDLGKFITGFLVVTGLGMCAWEMDSHRSVASVFVSQRYYHGGSNGHVDSGGDIDIWHHHSIFAFLFDGHGGILNVIAGVRSSQVTVLCRYNPSVLQFCTMRVTLLLPRDLFTLPIDDCS